MPEPQLTAAIEAADAESMPVACTYAESWQDILRCSRSLPLLPLMNAWSELA
jgi:hypothetical protein